VVSAILSVALLVGLILGLTTGQWYSLAAVAVLTVVTVWANWDALDPRALSGDR
jgi:hypothetical protein